MEAVNIKKIVEQEEIFSIDIRYINDEGGWCGFSFPASTFDINCLKNNLIIEDILIKDINIDNYFIDPFLAHKTLVFLCSAEIVTGDSMQSLFHNKQAVAFNIYDNKKDHKAVIGYHMPPYDSNRDIRTEIIMSLAELNIYVLYHYYNGENNKHIIVIAKNTSSKINNENICKVKYASKMVAKAYGIDNYIGNFSIF